jgi:3-phenylpropionate/cinnamic acid dioxygenase small subunit
VRDPIEALVAVEEIKQLKARYFRLLDTKRWEEWRDLFLPDATFSTPRMNGGSETLAAFFPTVSEGLADWETAHHGHLPEIRITGPDTAAGTWSLNDYLVLAHPSGRRSLRGYGQYDETYARTKAGWRIATLRMHYLRLEAAEGDQVPATIEFPALSPDWLPIDTPIRPETLADIEAIKQLKARYFRALDAKQWDEWRALFTDDATFEFGDVRGDSGDAFAETASRTVAGTTTAHHGHMPEIRVTGDGRARGIWVLNDYVEWRGDEMRRGIKGYGHYEEEYARAGGVWKIASLRLSYLRLDELSGRPLATDEGPRLATAYDRPSAPLDRLADVEEIQSLKARSLRALDARDWSDWRALFTADAVIDDVPVDEVAAVADGRPAATRSVHHAHMPEIHLEADDEAGGVWSTFTQVVPTDGEPIANQDFGNCVDRYRREAGTWRIASVRNSYLRRDRLTDEQAPRLFDWSQTAYD